MNLKVSNTCTAAEDGRRTYFSKPRLAIVKLFNHYFVSVFTQDADIFHPDSVDEVLANPELCDLAFTTNQVLAVLSSLNVNKSSGPDKIPARKLRETAHKIAPSLCDLFNKLLSFVSLLTE